MRVFTIAIVTFLIVGCTTPEKEVFYYFDDHFQNQPYKTSNPDYINSPFLVGGDRLYLVGHQNGTFPDIGWHIQGEMGGLWDAPIKLLDGYSMHITNLDNEDAWCLKSADEFRTYPTAAKILFSNDDFNLDVEQLITIPDGIEGVIIEAKLKNRSQKPQKIELAFSGLVDLMPTWLNDSLSLVDNNDELEWDEENQLVVGKDAGNPWYVLFGSNRKIDDHYFVKSDCYESRKGKGKDGTITTSFNIEAADSASVRFFIAGSYESSDKAMNNYQQLFENPDSLINQKIERYKSIQEYSKINIPDKELQEMYDWVKFNTDWLIRDVETVGRGLSAGIPDYPWWFGTDNGYTLEGLLSVGQHEEVKSTIELIYQLSNQVNGNGRVMHEASNNGVVFNPGNLNTTARFIHLLWKYYEWTGDLKFLVNYYPEAVKGLEWLESQDTNGNMYPDGHGMMEIHGLNSEMIDVVVYLQMAYKATANMAERLNRPLEAEIYQKKANLLKRSVNEDWWVERSDSYADFKASKRKTLQLVDQAIVRADTLKKPWAVEELKETRALIAGVSGNRVTGHVVHHNWVVNTPMEAGIANDDYAELALETARRYTNRFGVYVTGIDRDESQEKSSKWQSFSYVGAVMTLPTGVQAIAECNYGNVDEALEYLKMLHNSFSYAFPGSLYEVSPDYGMISQAWTVYSVAVPIVNHFFGINPIPADSVIKISPDFPSSWSEGSIENVRVGQNMVSYSYSTSTTGASFEINQTQPEEVILFEYPTEEVQSITLNGDPVEFSSVTKTFKIRISGPSNTIIIQSEQQ